MADLLFTINNTGAVSYDMFYRIRNTTDPWNGPHHAVATPGPTTQLSIIGVPPNDYEAYVISNCANGSSSGPTDSFFSAPNCQAPVAMNATFNAGIFTVTYAVAPSVGSVQLQVQYPNGGTFNHIYNVASPFEITIPQPVGLYGDYLFSIRSVCNQDSGWTSAYNSPVLVETVNPSPCTPPSINNTTVIATTAAAVTYRFELGGYTSSVRVVIDNNTTSGQQILTQAVVSNHVDIALVKGSVNYNYTVSIFNLCDAGADNIGDSESVVVPSSAPLVNVAGWTISAGPDNVDVDGDGVFGTMVTINTNGTPPSATQDCRVIVRFNCTSSGFAYVNVVVPAGTTTGITRDWNSVCTVDVGSAFIVSADLL